MAVQMTREKGKTVVVVENHPQHKMTNQGQRKKVDDKAWKSQKQQKVDKLVKTVHKKLK